MSNVSTRVSNNNLIELAKQNYEKTQTSMIPGVIVHLPSGGKVYPKSNPCSEGVLEMRHMTAYDEDILTNGSYIKEGIVFDKLITALVITPGFNVDTLIELDKEWLIISARISGYGAEYPVTVKAPNGKSISETINLNKLKPPTFELESDNNGEFDYVIDDTHSIKYRYIASSILKQLPTESAVSYFLEQSIRAINQNRNPEFIRNFLRTTLTPVQSRKFRTYIQQTMPILKLTYEFSYETTEGSKEAFQSTFPIGSDFFWI